VLLGKPICDVVSLHRSCYSSQGLLSQHYARTLFGAVGPLDYRSDGSHSFLGLGVQASVDADGDATYLLSECCSFQAGSTLRQ